jgi:WD40 repeat protein/serine/threonine protein kinase
MIDRGSELAHAVTSGITGFGTIWGTDIAMGANYRCQNGHDWPGWADSTGDQCPVCGAVGDNAPTVSPATVVAPRAVLPSETPTAGWDGQGPTPAFSTVPVAGYEILGELGRGGMGVVFRARNLSLNRIVALKMVLSGELASAVELARFKSEAEAAAQLQHPNIVQIYEFGETKSGDGSPLPFFALEYVSGGSLADRLDGTPQPARLSAALIEDLARAMHYAHTQGVIHRDLKPANVLLQFADGKAPITSDDTTAYDLQSITAKITDFGLAKRMDSSTGQTQSGAILGTPQYMAPEQAAGKSKRVGPGTDIYALGAILYELITGRPPFQGETPLETILQVTRDEPVAPRLLNPGVPHDLETITLKCLQKDPGRRYDTAQALAEDLARFLDDQPITARPAGPVERSRAWMRRHPTATALLAVTLVAAVSLLALAYQSHHELAEAFSQVRKQRDKAERRLVDVTVANGARRTDDGDFIMALPWYVEALRLDSADPAKAAVHRMRLAAALAPCPPLVAAWSHAGKVTDVAFRPDNGAAASSCECGTVCIWDPAHPDQPARRFEHLDPVTRIFYRPDGQRLLIIGGKTAHIWDPAGGPDLPVNLVHPGNVTGAAWTPDSRRIVTACADGVARVWGAKTGQPTGTEFRQDGGVTAIAVSHDVNRVATGGMNGTARVWDLVTGKQTSPSIATGNPVAFVSIGPQGQEVLTGAGPTAQLWDANTGEEKSGRLTYRQPMTDVALSPNGLRVAIASFDGTGGVWNFAKLDWADDVLKHGSVILSIAFSQDSQWVATASDDNTARVWNAENDSPRTPPLPHAGTVGRAVFSPDGRWLLTAGEDGLAKLWKLPEAKTASQAKLPTLSGPREVRSRDGSIRLTATGQNAQVFDARTDKPLSKPLVQNGQITSVALSPDGTLAATASTDRTAVIWNWRTGEQIGEPLRHASRVNSVVFSPDGRRVATGSDDNTARVWDGTTAGAITSPLPLPGTVHAVRFDPEGRMVLAAGKGLYARVWDASGGEAIALVPRTEKWVAAALDEPNSTMKWDLPTDPRPVEELRALAEWLSGHRMETPGGLVPLDGDKLLQIGERVRAAGK